MIDESMSCTCGKYKSALSTVGLYFTKNKKAQEVCENCGLFTPNTLGLFIQGDTTGNKVSNMHIPEIEFMSLRDSAIIPVRGTTHAYCYDVFASIGETRKCKEFIDVPPNRSVEIGIGFAIRIEEGYGMKVYSRSGQARNFRVSLTNSIGIIEPDFSNEIMIMLTNLGDKNFKVSNGQAIAQIEIQKHQPFTMKLVKNLSPIKSNRTGGFGSTDKK